MIIIEKYSTRKDGVKLNRTYSDQGLKIRKVGTEEIYDEAIDVEGTVFIYEETDLAVGSDEGQGEMTS